MFSQNHFSSTSKNNKNSPPWAIKTRIHPQSNFPFLSSFKLHSLVKGKYWCNFPKKFMLTDVKMLLSQKTGSLEIFMFFFFFFGKFPEKFFGSEANIRNGCERNLKIGLFIVDWERGREDGLILWLYPAFYGNRSVVNSLGKQKWFSWNLKLRMLVKKIPWTVNKF